MEVESFKPYELTRAFHLGLRALGRRYSHREVAARLARHQHAGSLLAVVDLASSFGTAVTAARCDLGEIDSETVPVMLQLQNGEDSGFTVVVASSGDRFSILDAGGVPRLISRFELDRRSTGVAVFLEASPGPGRPERAYLLNRVRDMPTELGERLARRLPIFSGTGGTMRLLALALLAASAVLALWSAFGTRAGILAACLTAVVTFGASLSLVLLAVSRPTAPVTSRPSFSQRLCNSGGLLDCDSILHGRWASVGPWTLASLGAAWFLSLLAAFGWAGVLAIGAGTGVLWLALSLLLAAPVSLFLVLVQIWPLKKLCPLCMVIHMAVFAGAAASWYLLAPRFPQTLHQLATLWPIGLLQIWFFSLVLGLLMPWIKHSGEIAKLTADFASATATPLGSLALTLVSPPLVAALGPDLLCWGDLRTPLVVDGFVNPTCASCGPVLRELVTLAQSHGDRVRVVIHLIAKDGSRRSSEHSLLLALMVIASLRGRDAALEAFWTIEQNPEPWLREAASGAGQVGARLAGLHQEEIDEVLPQAREALGRASAFARLARSGLPFFLVAGRRFPSAVRHLSVLVNAHYPLLLESLGIDGSR